MASKQKSTCEAEELSEPPPSELISESPRELDLVDLIQPGENIEEPTSELPELDSELVEFQSQLCDDCSTSKLDSELGKELSLLESNNQSKIPVLKSELLDDLLGSSHSADESKDSLAAPLQLTGAALARRLNVSPSTLRHKKNARNFGQWTQRHDPDGIAWCFDGQQFVVSLP